MPSLGQDLRICIGEVCNSVFLTHSQDSCCCRFPDHVVIYGIMPFRKGRFGQADVLTTPWLSHRTEACHFKGTPNIRNLYRSATIMLCATLSATNSLPNEDDSMVFCFFECHTISAFCKKMRIPGWDRLVTMFPA